MFKYLKFKYITVFALLSMLIGLVLKPVNAQPFAGWEWQRSVTINNTSGSALSDYQISINLNNSNFNFNNAIADGGDLRVTSSDGVTEIPFWIEDWDKTAQQATIWVKVPSIPTTGDSIYLYYGNPNVTSVSNGTSTFLFFDDFNTGGNTIGYWGGFIPHDWKYSMHMQEGALYYSLIKAQNGWLIESLDAEIEDEFDYMNTQINTNGTVTGLSSEPIYCYGLVLSNLALGYKYFRVSNPTLAQRCYDDMVNVYGYVRDNYGTPTNAPDYSLALQGLANACKAFTTYGNTTLADEARSIIVNYVSAFTQYGGGWTEQSYVQDHLKRDFGVLLAYDVTADASYLTKVRDNIDWILINRWVSSNGGLTWTSPTPLGEFYECHQIWFMIAVRMLYDRNNSYNYLTQGEQAWHFLTDTNYPNIDMYVHNYINHNTFFSYRLVTSDGLIQPNNFKGSYEIGTALWGMSLNYSWVSNYQSSHSTQAYNYLDMMVHQIKNTPTNRGYFSTSGNWIRSLAWNETAWVPDPALWTIVGVTVQIVEDEGSNVLSLRGGGSHDFFLRTNNTSFNNFVFETKVKLTQDVNNTCTPEIGFRWTNNSNRYITLLRGETQNDLFLRKYYNGTGYIDATTSYNYNVNQYYKYKIVANVNTISLYLDDDLLLSPTNVGGDVLNGGFCLQNYGNVAVYYDDVRVRSFTTNEPTTIVGTEKSLSAYQVYLCSSAYASAGIVYPNDGWGTTTYEPDDWNFNSSLTFYIVPEVGSIFGASDITVQWDNTLYSYAGVENTGIYAGLNFQSLHSTSGVIDQVIINAARIDNSNFTISAGHYITKLKLNLLKSGYGTVNFTALDFRAFNGIGGQTVVSVIGNNGQVKSYLGDVASSTLTSTGDGLVSYDDLTIWSGSYWSGVGGFGMTNYKVKYDVGPTNTNTVYGMPTTDAKIQFEDLVIFSMSYGLSANHVYPKISIPQEPVELQLGEPIIVGNQTRIPLYVSGGVENLRAMSLTFAGQFGKLASVEKGSLLTEFTNPVMVMNKAEANNIYVDLAVFGAEETGICSEGEVLTLILEGNASIQLSSAELRNALNAPMAVKISGRGELLPKEYALIQNYPNPFNPVTTINYEIPMQSMVEINIYNALGEKVAVLVNEMKEAGRYNVEFNAAGYSSGIYIYQIKANEYVSVKKMILMK